MRREDQKAINTFGRLNGRLHELEEELKEKNSAHELLDDAQNELILADDDEPVRCVPRCSSSVEAAQSRHAVRALNAQIGPISGTG